MDGPIPQGILKTVPLPGGRDASNMDVIRDSNVKIVNRGDCNKTHVGPDNRYNRGVVVNGGNALNITIHRESTEILNELRRVPAHYDSSFRKQAQECMQETRVAILNTVYEWIDASNIDSPPIFWLHGPAGTGKSTIAHTVAQECRRRGRLGASFFFSYANAECSDASLFFSTIAYQLSKFDPDLRQHIIEGVRVHSSPQDASIPTQLEEFILTPLRKLFNGPAREPIIVVIDALDECSDAQKASEILQLLSAKILSLPLRLKFLITSRPEPEIRSILHPDIHHISRSFDLLRDIDSSSTDSDIKRFLRFQLSKTGKEYELPSWPREIDVETLAQQSGGLFIFAHTTIELIRDKDVMDPESQLIMLNNIGPNGTPTFNLNALYSNILQKAVPETVTSKVQKRVITVIHALVGLRAPLALCSIERLLELDCGAIRAALNRLRSIFIIPDNDEDTIQLVHASFARYITDEGSCTEKRFFVDSRRLHGQLAKHCLKQMKGHLKQNICNLKDFTAVEVPIKNEANSDHVWQPLSGELRYSCQHFATHVYSADWQDGELGEMMAEWANHYLLYWLEALAIIGSFHDVLPSLRLLTKFCEMQTSKAAQSKSRQTFQQLLPELLRVKARAVTPDRGIQWTESLQLLADAIRIVSESYDDIKRFPHLIYSSCLGFCPLHSMLFKQYSRLSAIRVLRGERKYWRPLLRAFNDPHGPVISLTFSPDGTMLASCSSVGRILLWNLETSESRLLVYHTLCNYTAFTFSPDGKHIAADGNVYRIATGEEALTPGTCSALSSDGLHIALGCANGIIRLHDMQASNHFLLGKLFGHERMVTTLAFSSDNKSLVSVSLDDTVRVWDCKSLEMIKLIPCRGPFGFVTISPDWTHIAACYGSFSLGKEFRSYALVVEIQTGKEKFIEMLDDQRFPKETTTIFSPKGNYIAFCNNKEVRAARCVAATQASSTLLFPKSSSAITSISFTQDEQHLLIGNEQGLIRSWRVPKDDRVPYKLAFQRKAHFGAVQAMIFSHNGKYFASASVDGSICVWDATSVDLHEPEDLTDTSVKYGQTAIFSPDGQTVAIASGNTISKMDATTGHSVFHSESSLYQAGHSLIFSADAKYLASKSLQKLLFWDTGTHCTLGRRQIPLESGDRIIAQAFSLAATHYAVRFSAGGLWVHDLRSGESRQIEHTNKKVYVNELRFSPNGRYLVSCSALICVFDVEKGVATDLDLHVRSKALDCAFSPCGQFIAIAHGSGLDVIEFYVKSSARKVREVHRQDGYGSVGFSPDSKYILAAAREDGQLDLFHPDTLEILYTVKLWSGEHVYQAMREFTRTGRLLNHALYQSREYEDFPYLLDEDGWVITASSKRICRLPVVNRGVVYDVNGNRIVVVSPEGKVALIQFGQNPVCIPTPP